ADVAPAADTAPAAETAPAETAPAADVPVAPAEEPAEEPADVTAEEVPATDLAAAAEGDPELPSEPELPELPPCLVDGGLEGCYGTGKTYAGVFAEDGANLEGAVFELDVAGTSPEPEWTGTTDAWGSVPGWYTVAAGRTVTIRLVDAPDGSMAVGETSGTFGPCGTDVFMTCSYDLDVELVRAYRALDVDVRSTTGAPVAHATFELWGAPAPEPAEPEPLRLLAAPAPADLVLIGSATTDANGRLSFGAVPTGAYELRSTAVPAGYQELASTVPVTVADVLRAADATTVVASVSLTPVVVPSAPVVTPVATPVAAPVATPVVVQAAPVRPAAARPA
ncbi:prealbumin-like fold domain-containing protein, partial [Actinotalea ferrariae]|uniref:prealbumin-like fold domain-containing protein n=1 Tax=Actinotalea ferrariae TaxID=1386098 RepID=UPI001C8CD223